jgi:hypothetical protein
VNPPEPGWYRDPYFKNRERYWDGEIWTDECRLIQPALPSGQRAGAPAAGSEPMGRHAVRPDPVTAQQPAVAKDPATTQQPAAQSSPAAGDTQPIRISSGTVAGAGVGAFFGANGPAARRGPTVAGGTPAGTTDAAPATAAGAAAETAGAGAAAEAAAGAETATTETGTTDAITTETGTTDAVTTETGIDEAETAAAQPTKAEAAARAERVRTVGAAALLGGDVPVDVTSVHPPTRSVKTPKEPPQDATRRIVQEADPLLGVSMPGTNSAAAATAIDAKTSKSHRRGLLVAVVAVVVVLAGLGAYLALDHKSSKGGGHGGGDAAASKNPVSAAAAASVKQKTATIAVDVKVTSTGLGQTQGPNGTGGFKLVKQQGTMNLTVPGLPASAQQQQLVFDKKTVYVNLGSALSAKVPGKTWVSGDVLDVSSSTQGIGTTISGFEQMVGNPAGLLHQLKGNGLTIVSLGASTFDGVSVQGYTVTLSSNVLNKYAAVVPASHNTETVYVADGLIKAIVIPTTVNSSGQLFHEDSYVVYSSYGAPVTVTLPPPADVITIDQYRAASPTTTAPTASTSAAESPGSG